MRKSIVFAALTGVILLIAAPSAYATCPSSQFLQHGFGSYISNCTEPATGFARSLPIPGAPNATDSTGFGIVCNEAGTLTAPQLIPCQVEAGTANDGNVTIQFDWGGIGGVVGCPNPTSAAGIGRNIVRVVDADGKEANLTVGFSEAFFNYLIEAAHTADTPGAATALPLPLTCRRDTAAGLTVLSSTAGTGDTTDLTLNMTPYPGASDCNPDSLAAARSFGTCTETVARGRVLTRQAPCATTPSLDTTGSCTAGFLGSCSAPPANVGKPCNSNNADCDSIPFVTFDGVCDLGTPAGCTKDTDCDTIPGPTGSCVASPACTAQPPAGTGSCCFFPPSDFQPGYECSVDADCVGAGSGDGVCTVPWTTVAAPPPAGDFVLNVDNPAAPDCTYVGASWTFDGVDSGILGAFRVQSALAAADTARITSAVIRKGKVIVTFETASELSLVGFDVLADGNLLNAQIIPATGVGAAGDDYEFVGKKGKLKGGEMIVIRSRMSSGTIDSEPFLLVNQKGKSGKGHKAKNK